MQGANLPLPAAGKVYARTSLNSGKKCKDQDMQETKANICRDEFSFEQRTEK